MFLQLKLQNWFWLIKSRLNNNNTPMDSSYFYIRFVTAEFLNVYHFESKILDWNIWPASNMCTCFSSLFVLLYLASLTSQVFVLLFWNLCPFQQGMYLYLCWRITIKYIRGDIVVVKNINTKFVFELNHYKLRSLKDYIVLHLVMRSEKSEKSGIKKEIC